MYFALTFYSRLIENIKTYFIGQLPTRTLTIRLARDRIKVVRAICQEQIYISCPLLEVVAQPYVCVRRALCLQVWHSLWVQRYTPLAPKLSDAF